MKVRIVDSENEKTIMVFDIEDELYDDIKKMADLRRQTCQWAIMFLRHLRRKWPPNFKIELYKPFNGQFLYWN